MTLRLDGPAAATTPLALPENELSTTTIVTAPFVLSPRRPLFALLSDLTFVSTAETLPPTPGLISIPPPVAPLPFSETVVRVM